MRRLPARNGEPVPSSRARARSPAARPAPGWWRRASRRPRPEQPHRRTGGSRRSRVFACRSHSLLGYAVPAVPAPPLPWCREMRDWRDGPGQLRHLAARRLARARRARVRPRTLLTRRHVRCTLGCLIPACAIRVAPRLQRRPGRGRERAPSRRRRSRVPTDRAGEEPRPKRAAPEPPIPHPGAGRAA